MLAKRINSKKLSFSSFLNKEMIRIPSMSWYIQNCILPKKGKEIQETIEEYIRSGGSLHSKSLPKQLASKRKSSQFSRKNSYNNSLSMKLPDYTYGNDYKFMDRKSSEVNEPFNKKIVMNPELKNLNLKAVESIVLQKLINQKIYNSDHNFLRPKKVKQQNRIKTAA